MANVFRASVVMALGLAGCASPPRPGPPVWTADYAVPFNSMVNCVLTAPSGAGDFTIGPPDTGIGGIVTIRFIPANTPQASSYYRIYHLPGNGTQVNWHRAHDVMGLDWLDAVARTRANGCGGVSYQAALGDASQVARRAR